MNGLKPYPSYKDSGLPWLGEVPEHWELLKGKRLFVKMERTCSGNEDIVTCFRDGVVTLRKNRRVRGFTESLKEIGYQGIRKGDLVIHAMDAFAGAIGVSDSDGKGTPVYQVLKPREMSNAYFFSYCFHEMARSSWILALAKGVRERSTDFRFSDFGSEYLAVPPLPEQEAIVRYLDYMDRRIRRYINAKKKLIALLNEQKQAIIHQAVTRGLDPNARLKPSGIEWLGDIPEHWEQKPIWQVFRLGRGKVTSNEYIFNNQGEYPVFSSQTESEGVMGYINSYMFDGDYLTWTTDGAQAGTVFKRSGKFNCTNVCGTLKPQTPLDLTFMQMALSSETKRYVRLDINPKLMNNVMARIRINVAPYEEQVEIGRYVQDVTKPISVMVDETKKEIEYLLEYRTRLIADVVTGKLDVREAAANLPEEAEEEPVEEVEIAEVNVGEEEMVVDSSFGED